MDLFGKKRIKHLLKRYVDKYAEAEDLKQLLNKYKDITDIDQEIARKKVQLDTLNNKLSELEKEYNKKNSVSEGNKIDTIVKIVRSEHTEMLKTIDYGRTNLSSEIQKKVLEEITFSLTKGESPKNCKAKNHIPDDFEWVEYDEWYKKFYDAGEWPRRWEDAADCFFRERECESMDMDELLDELDKTELLTIAERFNLGEINGRSVKFIYTKLLEVIKPEDKETRDVTIQMIRSRIKKDLPKSLIREKKFLYQHTLMAITTATNKRNEWKASWVNKVEFSPAPDTCSFCAKLAGVYPISEVPIPGKDTHPGCGCSFIPADY